MTRLVRLITTPLKVALVLLLVGLALILAVRWAGPIAISTGPGHAGPFAVHSASSSTTDPQLKAEVDLFLAQFDNPDRASASAGGGTIVPRDFP